MSNPRPRILLVEDETDTRNNWSEAFGEAGYDCVPCGTIEEARKALADQGGWFEVAIVDLFLNGGEDDGWTLIGEIGTSYPTLQTVALTGLQDDEAGVRAYERGATFYLNKPIQDGLLLTLVAVLRKQHGRPLSKKEEHLIKNGESWALLTSLIVKNQKIVKQLTMSQSASRQRQKVIDAMAVEVAVLDPDGKVVQVNEQLRKCHQLPVQTNDNFLREEDLWDRDELSLAGTPTSDRGANNQTVRTSGDKKYLVHARPIEQYIGGKQYTVLTATDITTWTQVQELLHKLPLIETKPIREAAGEIVKAIKGFGHPRVQFYCKVDEKSYELMASTEYTDAELRSSEPYHLSTGDYLLKKAAQDRRPIQVHRSEVPLLERRPSFQAADVEWFVRLVLQSGGRPLGVLCIEIPPGHEPATVDELLVLEVLGPALGDAVSVVLKYQEEEQRRGWTEFMHSVHKRFAELEREEDVLTYILVQLSERFAADSSYILQRTEEVLNELKIVYCDKVPPYGVETYRSRSDLGVNGRCYREKRVQIIERYQDDPDLPEYLEYIRVHQPSAFPMTSELQSLILLPIMQADEPIGMLVLIFMKPRTFAPWINEVLQEISDLIVLILANIQRRTLLEDEARRKTTLEEMAMLGAGILHRIKNELTVAKAALQLLQRKRTVEAIDVEIPDAMRRINTGFEISDRFADLSRPQSTAPSHFDFVALVNELAESARYEMTKAGIQYLAEFQSKVLLVYAPREAIKIVLFDFFTNAIRSMSRGGRLTTRLKGVPKIHPHVQLEIEDTGAGMGEKELKRLFRFGPRDPIPPGGIGLGLYLAYKVITTSKGSIDVESELGRGTKFTIQLPVE